MKLKKILTFLSTLSLTVLLLGGTGLALEDKPVVYYNFDNNIKDSSTNSNDAQTKSRITYTKGVKGNAAELKEGFLEIINSNAFDIDKAFSVSVWINQDSHVQRENPVIFKPAPDTDEQAVVYFGLAKGSTTLASYLGFGQDYENNAADIISQSPLSLSSTVGRWSHFGYVFDGKQQKYYVNGQLMDTNAISAELLSYSITQSSKNILLGKGYESNFKGLMDEFKLYDYALTDEDMLSNYNSIVTSPDFVPNENPGTSKYKNKIVLQIGNEYLESDDSRMEIDPGRGTKPIIVQNRTLVPIRAIIEIMGGTVNWDAAEKRIDVNLKGNSINLWIDRYTADVNGNKMFLDVAPEIINERTMLPLRFVSENLGADVDWEAESRKITIKYSR